MVSVQRIWGRIHQARVWWHPALWVAGWLWAAGVAVGFLAWATARWGPHANSDGITYLLLARSLVQGLGYGYPSPNGFHVVTHFPPGYPLLIAAWTFLTRGEEAAAARLLHLVLVPLLLALAMREAQKGSGHLWPAVALAGWLAVAYPMQWLYTGVFSEVPFLTGVLAVSWALDRWLERRTWPWAVLTGLLAAWSTYVRWVGVGLIPWVLSVVWTHLSASFRRGFGGRGVFPLPPETRSRVWEGLGFLLAAGVPVLGLMLVNRLMAGTAISRAVLWHPPGAEKWEQFVTALATWSRPILVENHPESRFTVAGYTAAAVLVLWAVGFVLTRRQAPNTFARSLRWVLFIVWYMATVLGAITLVDASTPLDSRILAPVFLAGSVVTVLLGWHLAARYWWMAVLLFWIGQAVFRFHRNHDLFHLAQFHRIGGGLRSAPWQTADLWPVLRRLPEDIPLLATEFPEVPYYVHHPAAPLVIPGTRNGQTVVYDPVRGEFRPLPYPNPQAWAEALRRAWQDRCAVLVIPNLQSPEYAESAYRFLSRYFPTWKVLESGYLLVTDAKACSPYLPKEGGPFLWRDGDT